ncbi:ComF family protein [Sandaracinobacter neustonicus]|uniref:ComF family protein n=1 Tax=Sandaracinobacter neustonicus TaxID=1715348 RepID=A0A501XD44_9SPHN|nr:double zinc ribbon domain-containing protein [Sandaracinobacter neustonicus]TPE58538.1 ComF family protein [Sandaracinobacter neustonicus]
MAADSLILASARSATRALFDLLMPPACMACKAPVATPISFCGDCYAALKPISGARCLQCAVPLPLKWQTETHCLGCLSEPPRFDRTAAPFLYDGPTRQLVLAFKNGREAYAAPMAAAMLRAAPGWAGPETLVSAVPLHRWRLASRGYNQALVLARAIASATGAPLDPELLLRVKATRSTRGLTRPQRQRNVQGAFRLADGAKDRISGRDILLIDDVMTSGATASAAAGVLKRGGAARVSVLVHARVAATDMAPYVEGARSQDDHGQS